MTDFLPFADALPWIAGIGLPILFVLGALSALDAIMQSRTPQGSTAWALALLFMPIVALPLYWTFGRFGFDDYKEAMDKMGCDTHDAMTNACDHADPAVVVKPEERGEDKREVAELEGFRRLSTTPMTKGNSLKLLINGEKTFDAIFDGIDRAERYLLVQYYLIRDDDIGKRMKSHLIQAAKRGVHVRLIYDDIASHALPKSYRNELEAVGVEIARFSGSTRSWGRLRLNFRNHRKIVVIDGREAFAGGLNVGDEYLGHTEDFPHWRDTHLHIIGPAVLGYQFTFARDWFYTKEEHLDNADWVADFHPDDQQAMVLASGPDDELEACGLLFAHAIESAETRVWIATPYFVPDGRVLAALQLAALRGVDVRILMPRTSDSVLFKYVPYAYLDDVEMAGGSVHLYEPGFAHQKVMLIDDDYAMVGSANMDNRSFRLNFEVSCLANDERFCNDVKAMLEDDFAKSTKLSTEDVQDQSFRFRLAVQFTRLLAPIL